MFIALSAMNIKPFFLFSLIQLFIDNGVSTFSDDIIVNSTASSNWSSQQFIISLEMPNNYYWEFCRRSSKFYCLLSFISNENNSNPAFETDFLNLVVDDSAYRKYQSLKWFACEECRKVFRPVFAQHNLFIFWEGCCLGHNFNYFSYGFQDALLTPKEYLAKLTDYSEEDKKLNYILAYYLPDCDVNIISKLGFGSGNLKRLNHHFVGSSNHKIGRPYQIKAGDEWTPKIPYENPEDFVTFRWFKKNIMCLDQPWICRNDEKEQSSGSKIPHTSYSWWKRLFGTLN